MNRIETITFVYNEEFLLPFFLKHYDFVDRLNIVYDTDSTDRTLSLLREDAKVNVIPFTFPYMMDDVLKVRFVNEIYASLADCWVLNVDCDEFVFLNEYIKGSITSPINRVALHNVYRNKVEKELDVKIPVKEQRRHGELDHRYYIKPIFVRSGLGVQWDPGNHTIKGKRTTVLPVLFTGAHWANADPCFCVDRRVRGRKERQSEYNLKHRLTVQHHGITEQDVIEECRRHENDPGLW